MRKLIRYSMYMCALSVCIILYLRLSYKYSFNGKILLLHITKWSSTDLDVKLDPQGDQGYWPITRRLLKSC